ncbi:family 16 glycosylhydrolase [Methylobacterium oryzihabitans]|uniref:Glycosyl hydrolase family protein n=1 Tax=Methylobacterium oryzihabitans TaxID=2499852 RepID=A0A3S2W9Z9_9HYPH|nr:family 16 glycosylhydrolase [Methylobacterium oryzihabitans]RVU17520.1 glycosyl hydrolase family protein [Methylobacterium oryzihabitans]
MALPTSAKPTKTFSAVTATDTVTGTAGADRLVSVGSITTGGATLIGGAGDDTYSVNSIRDKIVEKSNEGVDTVQAFGSYRLPDNVENLILRGSNGLSGRGNGLANIITGNAGDNLIDGGGGGDEITGGGGNDLFRVHAGDTITDFSGGLGLSDFVDLQDYAQFSSFADVRLAMTQENGNTILTLGDGQTVTFLGVRKSDFVADDFLVNKPTTNYQLTFADEFNALNLYTGDNSPGTWEPNYPRDGLAGHTVVNHDEVQYYTDPTDPGSSGTTPLGLNPFSIDSGVLTIEANRVDPATSSKIYGYDYTSGMLSSYPTFAQTFGYFEMRAKLPAGKGLHPAFWLLPLDESWPPELDVMEQRGVDPYQTTGTAHSFADGTHTATSGTFDVGDTTAAFHTYGVDWKADYITWYVDGEAVRQVATPSDMNKPMYMIANLAVGGPWAGQPTATTPFPAEMQIDYIRAYANEDTVEKGPVTKVGTAADGTLFGTNGGDSLAAGIGNHSIYGGAGNDVLQDGSDTAALMGQTGNDTYIVDNAATTIRELSNEGVDSVVTSLSAFTLPTYFENLSYSGRSAFTGTGNNANNVIRGGNGGNTLSGQGGDDLIVGGDMADTIQGGTGNDSIDGGSGNDSIRGGTGDDSIFGGNGNDLIQGEEGNDTINGGYGNDTIRGGAGANLLLGGLGSGADTFGGDLVVGTDTIDGGWSAADLYLITGTASDTVSVDLQAGTVTGGYRSGSRLTGIENLQLWTSSTATRLTGNAADNILTSGDAADLLLGGGGRDTLRAGAGADTLDGGAGADTLYGGTGADVFVLRRGEAQGDLLADFSVRDGDKIQLVGYGSGATFQASANDLSTWVVRTGDGSFSESVSFAGNQWNIGANVQFA